MRKLRISQVIIQPVLVWDDGEELEPAPPVGSVNLTLSKASEYLTNLPAQVLDLQERLGSENQVADNVDSSEAICDEAHGDDAEPPTGQEKP